MVVSEQRPARPLAHADRVLFMERGRIVLDAPRDEALAWLAANRPLLPAARRRPVCRLRDVRFAYGDGSCSTASSLEVRRGEIVALTGPNGVGRRRWRKIAAGLLDAGAGRRRACPRRVPRARIPAAIS